MPIHVSAVALVRGEEVLTVRKRGTSRFMLVGGKREPGESALECARREAAEEVGVRLGSVLDLGRLRADAANEPGETVLADCFAVTDWSGEPEARAEIAELRWLPITAESAPDLAPLLTERVLPLLRSRRAGIASPTTGR